MRYTMLLAVGFLVGCAAPSSFTTSDVALGEFQSITARSQELDQYTCAKRDNHMDCRGTGVVMRCTCVP